MKTLILSFSLFLVGSAAMASPATLAAPKSLVCQIDYEYFDVTVGDRVGESKEITKAIVKSPNSSTKLASIDYLTKDGRFLIQMSTASDPSESSQNLLVVIRDQQLKTVAQARQPDPNAKKASGAYNVIGDDMNKDILVTADCEVR